MRALHWLTGKRERRDELLSAYLDGELDGPEQARLEAQLAADPALQAELETLRQTVTLVREMPHIPAPRNFFLPQTTATRLQAAPLKQPRRSWSLSLLTTATIVVSLIFAVVLSGDVLRRAAPGSQMAYEAPREAPSEAALTSIPTEAPPPEEMLEPTGAALVEGIAPADESITPAATLTGEKEAGGGRQYTPEKTTVPPAPAGEEPGAFEESRARPVALEVALGLVALTLAAFTARAWLRRR